MKKIKITLSLIFVFLLTSNIHSKSNEISNEKIIISWVVKTINSEYCGTSNSLEEAENSIKKVCNGEKIIFTNYFEKEELSSNETFLYTWEIEINNETIQGTTSTFEKALKCIKKISENEEICYVSIIKEVYLK